MKIYSFFIIAILLTALGCSKKIQQPNTIAEFNLNKVQKINSTNFTVTNISDNRCPINAFCIISGKAEINLNINYGDKTKDIVLCIGGDCKGKNLSDEQSFKISNVNYTVKLLEVNPFNNFDKVPTAKTVKLKIDKL